MFRNKNVFSNAFVSCSLSKLAKSRALTFSSYAHHASTFFKMTWWCVGYVLCSFSLL